MITGDGSVRGVVYCTAIPLPQGKRAAVTSATAASRPDQTTSLRERAVLKVLHSAASRYRPGWLTAQPEDIAHRAYEKLRPRLDAGHVLEDAYLRRTAYTVCIDLVRSERAELRRRQSWGHPAGERQVSPEAAASARQVATHIADCLDALPETRRRVAVLYLQGHGATDISSVLEQPYKRIENLVYRALASLRKCLTTKGVVPP